MRKMDQATLFFEACEAPLGWSACKAYATSDASFSAQSEPIAEIKTLEGYCDWMHAFGTETAKGCSYTLHNSAWDEANSTAVFFATFHGTHVGEGGPVPATGQSTNSHYVYVVEMNDAGKVTHMTKIWNAPWAMTELGWV